MRLDSPPDAITSPATRKNGIANSGKLSIPLTSDCARMSTLKVSRCTISASADKSSANATGRPSRIDPISTPRSSASVIRRAIPARGRGARAT